MIEETTFLGYRRPDGAVGSRNYVAIIPVDDLSNAAVEGVAHLVPGVLPLPHPYGRLQFGDDLELHFRTLIGTGSNPNVAAAIVIGIEPNWTERIVDGIRQTGKPVTGFAIEGVGDTETIARAARQARIYLQQASEMQREPVSISDAILSIKCGESDTTSGLGSNPALGVAVDWLVDHGATVIFGETSEITGAEHIIARRCATDEVRAKYLALHEGYQKFIRDTGFDLLGSQPTQGNIAGGLSTIEEKALGNIQKTGTKPIVDALEPAVHPTRKGLNFMDSSSAAAEFITLMGAAGSIFHFFTTGQGNIVGNPVVPVLKTTANPKTARTMAEHIDVDVSPLLSLEMTLEEAGQALLAMMFRNLSGRLTAAEVLGHKEFVLTKLYRSA
ncbi:D-galactarate dehydratase/Altronate hydrolase-like protein [Sulfobacillus acidophilus TPY]|uniref:Galactarate dehydratase n=1 Tax=Sulfobacillus acidophilus (strain ATCC 700253 / DSM 10332 / NAL) TaxID=679936 RepID=G8TTH2_SULAD|nr:D-galactarate dehydratase/Altronate hydrolase-like protein [Sulfobacillus acidophilus TPY]AEW05638.1 Galactarate dehydratase [Sulfobacillus acidophilus DSM 10332]